jgi:hypothetical protein
MTLMQISLTVELIAAAEASSGGKNGAQTIADTQTIAHPTFSRRAVRRLAGCRMDLRDFDAGERRSSQGSRDRLGDYKQ